MPGAPSGHERARYGCVGQIDRDCIVDDATRAARGHCPAIGASILVEPRLHLIEPRPQPWSAAILIRTGNRRSASVIISLELAAMRFPVGSCDASFSKIGQRVQPG